MPSRTFTRRLVDQIIWANISQPHSAFSLYFSPLEFSATPAATTLCFGNHAKLKECPRGAQLMSKCPLWPKMRRGHNLPKVARIIEYTKKIATKLPPSCKARFARLVIKKVCQLIIYALWYNGLKIEKENLWILISPWIVWKSIQKNLKFFGNFSN